MTILHPDRVELNYTLTFTMPFHFGTGLRSGLLDRTIVRNRNGNLYVPASTIKGVWREKCEILERLYTKSELVDSPHNAKRALLGLGNQVTMSTRIFGSQQYPGRLFFEDAHLAEKEQEQFDAKEKKGYYNYLQTSNYTQVRLERPSRTSVPGALYTSEFGLRNFLFEGSVNGWLNCTHISEEIPTEETPAEEKLTEPTYSLLLLLAGLHMLERLGGNKSAGKGACICEITTLKINGKKIEKKLWQNWLEHLDILEHYEYKSQEENV